MDQTGTYEAGLGDEARGFLERRLEASESRMNAAPLGSVARAEAADEAREIRAILEADRRALAAANVTREQARPDAATCPSCRTPRIGNFRFCRACGHDFEASVPVRRATVRPRSAT